MSLKKPIDEVNPKFLNLLIDFMCFVSATCLGTDLDQLRYAQIGPDGKVVEHEVVLFGQGEVKPTFMPDCLPSGTDPGDFFCQFVIHNLLHLHDISRKQLGILSYSNFLLKSIAILMAFQQILFADPQTFKIFLNSYYIPILDDCFSISIELGHSDLHTLSQSVQYFIVEMLHFLYHAQQTECIREIVRFLTQNLKTKAKLPNKVSLILLGFHTVNHRRFFRNLLGDQSGLGLHGQRLYG